MKEYCVEGPCSEEIDVDSLINVINALRNCTSAKGSCAKCAYKSRVFPGTLNGCKWNVMRDAADAIEKLVSLVKQIQIKDDISSTGRKERT